MSKWIEHQERSVSVSAVNRQQIERLLVKTTRTSREPLFAWPRLSLLVPSLAIIAFVVFTSSPGAPLLTPEQVLAQVQGSVSVPDGAVELVTATPVINGVEKPAARVYTNGQWYYEPELSRWVERNDDDLTFTRYSYSAPEDLILRELVGDHAKRTGDRPDIDAWMADPRSELMGLLHDSEASVTFSPCEDCAAFELSIGFSGGDITLTEDEVDGEKFYLISSSGEPPQVNGLASSQDTVFITRNARIRASDYRLMERTWEAIMEDGTKNTGSVVYSYTFLQPGDAEIPTSLQEWRDLVDPDRNAEPFCHVYSSGNCQDALLQTDNHPPYYVPKGWL